MQLPTEVNLTFERVRYIVMLHSKEREREARKTFTGPPVPIPYLVSQLLLLKGHLDP